MDRHSRSLSGSRVFSNYSTTSRDAGWAHRSQVFLGFLIVLIAAPLGVQSSKLVQFGGNVNERSHWLEPALLDRTKTIWVRAFFPASVILKRGAAGSAVRLAGQQTEWFDTPQVRAVDSTAAGDSFNGALAVGLLSFASIAESMRFASFAAAISVTRAGAQPSLASRSEVERAIEEGISSVL